MARVVELSLDIHVGRTASLPHWWVEYLKRVTFRCPSFNMTMWKLSDCLNLFLQVCLSAGQEFKHFFFLKLLYKVPNLLFRFKHTLYEEAQKSEEKLIVVTAPIGYMPADCRLRSNVNSGFALRILIGRWFFLSFVLNFLRTGYQICCGFLSLRMPVFLY